MIINKNQDYFGVFIIKDNKSSFFHIILNLGITL